MTWLSVLAAVLAIAQGLTEYLRDRRIIDAATAQSILEGIRDADKAIGRAKAARALVRDAVEREPERLHDDDGYRRDGE